MKKEEIKRIIVVHNDNDFVRVWDWIGKIILQTITEKNICFEEMLETSEQIEELFYSLIPVGIEFAQYRCGNNQRPLEKSKLDYLVREFTKTIKFKYNFTMFDKDWEFGGSETLIIDLEKNQSYIH